MHNKDRYHKKKCNYHHSYNNSSNKNNNFISIIRSRKFITIIISIVILFKSEIISSQEIITIKEDNSYNDNNDNVKIIETSSNVSASASSESASESSRHTNDNNIDNLNNINIIQFNDNDNNNEKDKKIKIKLLRKAKIKNCNDHDTKINNIDDNDVNNNNDNTKLITENDNEIQEEAMSMFISDNNNNHNITIKEMLFKNVSSSKNRHLQDDNNNNNKTSSNTIMIILSNPSISDLLSSTHSNNPSTSSFDIRTEIDNMIIEQNKIISILIDNNNNIKILGNVQYVRNAIFIEVSSSAKLKISNYCKQLYTLLTSNNNTIKKVIPIENYYSTSSSFSSSKTKPKENTESTATKSSTPSNEYEYNNHIWSYIGINELQNHTKNNNDKEDIIIAVIDSGIDYTHVNLGGDGTEKSYYEAAGNLYNTSNIKNANRDNLFPTNTIIEGYDFVGDTWPITDSIKPDNDPIDYEGHGTHVADIILSIMPSAKLLAIKSCSSISTNICHGASLIRGIEYAIKK